MTEDNDYKYKRCQNCGKYFICEQEEKNMFCSEECRIYYRSCTACGKYFVSSRNKENIFCSPDCGINPEFPEPQTQLGAQLGDSQ